MLVQNRDQFLAGVRRELNRERDVDSRFLAQIRDVPGETAEEIFSQATLRADRAAARYGRMRDVGGLLGTAGFCALAATTLLQQVPLVPGLAVGGAAWLSGRAMASYSRRRWDWLNPERNLPGHVSHYMHAVRTQGPLDLSGVPERAPDTVRRAAEAAQTSWLELSDLTREDFLARGADLQARLEKHPTDELGEAIYGFDALPGNRELMEWVRSQPGATMGDVERQLDKDVERTALLYHEGFDTLDRIGDAAFWIGIFSNRVDGLLGLGIKGGIWALTSLTGVKRRVGEKLAAGERRQELLQNWRRMLALSDLEERHTAAAQALEAYQGVQKYVEVERPQGVEDRGEQVLIGGVAIRKK
ncbi:MAG: hypothetical protein AB1758_33970 [Candidatus Eremiobacterota bacterium]